MMAGMAMIMMMSKRMIIDLKIIKWRWQIVTDNYHDEDDDDDEDEDEDDDDANKKKWVSKPVGCLRPPQHQPPFWRPLCLSQGAAI